MHNNEDKIQELLIGQAKIFGQLDRIISDIESEKEVRKRRNDEIDKRLRQIEEWKANIQGRITVTLVVGGAIWGLIILVVTFIIKNKT